MAGGGGLYQRLQIVEQLWVPPGGGRATAPDPSDPSPLDSLAEPHLSEAAGNGGARDAGGSSHLADTAMAQGEGLRGSPQSP
jgi:hypothetical protein